MPSSDSKDVEWLEGHNVDHHVHHQVNGDSVCYHQECHLDLSFHLPFHFGGEKDILAVWGGHLIWMDMNSIMMASGITTF